jgi:hypothetical protein
MRLELVGGTDSGEDAATTYRFHVTPFWRAGVTLLKQSFARHGHAPLGVFMTFGGPVDPLYELRASRKDAVGSRKKPRRHPLPHGRGSVTLALGCEMRTL